VLNVKAGDTFLVQWHLCAEGSQKLSYSCNRPWRPIGFWDVEAPTFSRHLVHRWRWGCQPYAPAALYPQENSWYSFLLEVESTQGHAAGKFVSIEEPSGLIGNRTHGPPACSIVLQPTTLPLPEHWRVKRLYKRFDFKGWALKNSPTRVYRRRWKLNG
jgi:hypothetical protein